MAVNDTPSRKTYGTTSEGGPDENEEIRREDVAPVENRPICTHDLEAVEVEINDLYQNYRQGSEVVWPSSVPSQGNHHSREIPDGVDHDTMPQPI